MWATAVTGANFSWACNPPVTELEVLVLDWLARALGLPACFESTGAERGGGVIVSTASEAIVSVMAAARDAFVAGKTAHLLGEDKEREEWRLRSRLVALGSSGTHSSTAKAARILGLRYHAIPVGPDSGFALTAPAVAAALADLAARGLEPFYLTLTMGTTDVCAVDAFAPIAALLAPRPNLWVHVDAAYAGSALLLDAVKPLAASFAAFHSVTVNPHKWLLVNNDCSALWLRDRRPLVSTMSVSAPYLLSSASPDHDLVPDFRDWHIPLGRRFRALKLWFVLRSYGTAGLASHVQAGIDRARLLESKLRLRPDLFALVTPAAFGLLTFALVVVRPPSSSSSSCQDDDAANNDAANNDAADNDAATNDAANRLTRRLYDAINATRAWFLTSTLLNGRFVIRVQTATAAVRQEHIDALYNDFVDAAVKLLPSAAPN
ncbi:hypothetical protein CDD82_7856 [Ophiocordyceps australis]|uniref:Aromatic-L-amino-acid decarboxylase n=1 Tax=Ophiocordyceps australis TaxID=1399860 RepID=A0A2C5YIF6_9HYPO|nr:hypothetical protein CDD82_7856 [Ophiocordyceps australis]